MDIDQEEIERQLVSLRDQMDALTSEMVEIIAGARASGQPSGQSPKLRQVQDARNDLLRQVKDLCRDAPKVQAVAGVVGFSPKVWQDNVPWGRL